MGLHKPFIVMASITAKNGEGGRLLEGLKAHSANCLAKEPGCLEFDVARVEDQHDEFVLYEVYRDRDAFEAHRTSDHFNWFREQYGELVADRKLRFLTRERGKTAPKAKTILVTAKPSHRFPYLFEPLTAAGYEVILHEGAPLRDNVAVIEELEGVVATIASVEPYNEEVLSKSPSLEVIARMGVGHDQIDVAAATRYDVAVAMAFGTNHDAVADHAFGLLIAQTHKVVTYDRMVREGKWGTRYHPRFSGMTVGLVGLGRIGRAFARRCQGFNMRVLVADPLVDASTVARLGLDLVDLDKLLAESDFVSIHAPLADNTRHLLNAERIASMKKGAVIVNTARGPIIDEAAMIEALRSGHLGGAALDVFEVEPLRASPLVEMENVVLSPHVAGLGAWPIQSMTRRAVDNVLSVLAGKDPGSGLLLNPEVLAVGAPHEQ